MMQRLVLLVLAALGLAGCQWARMHYHDGAEHSEVLTCIPLQTDPNAFDCFDYFGTKVIRMPRVQPKPGTQGL